MTRDLFSVCRHVLFESPFPIYTMLFIYLVCFLNLNIATILLIIFYFNTNKQYVFSAKGFDLLF